MNKEMFDERLDELLLCSVKQQIITPIQLGKKEYIDLVDYLKIYSTFEKIAKQERI